MSMKVMDGAMQMFQTTYDLCSKKATTGTVISNIWGIPPYCPIRENFEYCYNGSKVATVPVSVQNMLQVFSVMKTVKFRIEITHDNGKSCFEAESSVTKKSK